VVEKYH